MKKSRLILLGLTLGLFSPLVLAKGGDIAFMNVINQAGGQEYSVKIQVLILMTLLGLLPTMVLMMTCFTRFIIVLSILRQAMGLQQTPPNKILIGIALSLTLLVMRPVWMMMLSPLIVSLPFKLMLFVLIDGWSLTVGTLTHSIQGLGLS